MARAIAYVYDIVLDRIEEVIPRSDQIERIQRFAADHEVEVVAWFEDRACNEDVLKRPGVRALLAYGEPYDRVICERVWALSRSMAVLEPFFQELDRRGVEFESATSTWDCVSQQCRRRSKLLPTVPRAAQLPDATGGRVRYRVAKPVRLNFVHLVHDAPSSMSRRR
jgi:hypothetical protein